MVTISRTKKYHELNLRLKKLVRLYAVVSELRLHTNLAVDKKTAEYYNAKLYDWSDASPFLTASLESMLQVFYIELDGFIGGYWSTKTSKVEQRHYESGSLSKYLYDTSRTTRKKSSVTAFESLLKDKRTELEMVHNLRGKLGHFTGLKERSLAYVPNDIDTRDILNKLVEIMYLLGFRKWNTPDYIEPDNKYVASTQFVIDKLVADDEEIATMRQEYNLARKKWFKSKL